MVSMSRKFCVDYNEKKFTAVKIAESMFFACWLKPCLLNLEHTLLSSFHKLWSKIWIKPYTFCCFCIKLTRSAICYGSRNIWIDLSEYWSFYGLKLPPKISFSRNFVHFVSSNSLTIWIFFKNFGIFVLPIHLSNSSRSEKKSTKIFLV